MSFKSCHCIGIERLDIMASMKQEVTVPASSNSTSVTIKCFSPFFGSAAVHLLLSNFLGLILFIVLSWFSPNAHRNSEALTCLVARNQATFDRIADFGRDKPGCLLCALSQKRYSNSFPLEISYTGCLSQIRYRNSRKYIFLVQLR